MDKNPQYYNELPYRTVLYYEPQDETWVAEHPELGSGTCYTIGKSREEALQLLEEERKELLELLIASGVDIPEPIFEEEELPSGQFLVRLPRTLHLRIKESAKKEGVSLNQYASSVLSYSLGGKELFEQLKVQLKSLWSIVEWRRHSMTEVFDLYGKELAPEYTYPGRKLSSTVGYLQLSGWNVVEGGRLLKGKN